MSDFYNKYPYTDFHELNLDWVIERVKKLTEDWLTTQEAWNNTQEQWQQLYDYVHDYFANLDVQDEINNKINQMILDGTFMTIVTPTINQTVVDATTTWLAAHITQPTTPAVDTSLSVGGAAADAAVTGLRLNTVDVNTATNTNIINMISPFAAIPFELGYVSVNAGNTDFQYSDSTQRIRTPQDFTIHLDVGDKIGLTSYSGYRYVPSRFDDTTQTYKTLGWQNVDITIAPDTTGDYVFMIGYSPDATVTDIGDLAKLFFCNRADNKISDIIEDMQEMYDDINEYQNKQDEKIDNLYGYKKIQFELGYVSTTGTGFTYSDVDYRVRTPRNVSYHLLPGTIVGLTDFTGKRFACGLHRTDNDQYQDYGWFYDKITIPVEGDYVFMLGYNPDQTITDITTLTDLFYCQINNEPVKMDMVIYNIGHFGYGGGETIDGHWYYKYGIEDSIYSDRLKNYKDFFTEHKADLAIITEYSRCLDRVDIGDSDADGTVSTKDHLFGPLYPYSVIVNSLLGPFLNNAIYSNYQLLDGKAVAVGNNDEVPHSYNNVSIGKIIIGDKTITVVCAHLNSGSTADNINERDEQIKTLISYLADEEYVIIAGDFNTTAGSSEYTRFTAAGYVVANTGSYYGDNITFNSQTAYDSNQDETAAVAWDDTYGNNWMLDNLIVTPNIKIQNFKVLYDWYTKLTSDHPPVIASVLIY